ncbi:Ig-like domain-containing protein [Pontiellaceae bacterium B1224]|nr:Ig-like domain-containing protein [Pontiellaceae bacterium B1224]
MNRKMSYLIAVGGLIAGGVLAGTVQQNLGFDPDGTFIIQQNTTESVSSAWNQATNNIVVLGQSFSLANETAVRAVTLVKGANNWTYSGGTNDLYLWIGEYSTNNTAVSTNVLEAFDLEGITLTNGSYFSLNLDADVVLPAGDYAFQFWPEAGNNTLTVNTGSGYAGGGFLRVKNPTNLPVDAVPSATQDLTFGLQSEVVGTITNVAPIANGQDVSTLPNQELAIILTGTDSDGVTNLIYEVVDYPTNGTLSGTAPDLIYTPDMDFEGMDRLTFTVDDGVYSSVQASVSITVTNIPPTAGAQSVSTLQNMPIEITLSGIDPEGSNLTYSVIGLPTNGMVSATDTNVLIYTPDSGITGNDSFTFKVNDGVLDSEPATVSITIVPTGTEVTFSSLSADITSVSNLLNVGDSTNGLTVSGVSTNGDYVYSVMYTDLDLDGDAQNDIISFDVRVSAVNGTTYTFSETSGVSVAIIGSGSETVSDTTGTPTYGYNPSGMAWVSGTAAQGMPVGDTLIYTVENISVIGSDYPLDASFLGFSGIVVAERTGYNHSTILGAGSGLNGYLWSDEFLEISDFSMDPLYVTSTEAGAGMRWGVSTVDLSFSFSSSAPPTSVGEISCAVIQGSTQIALRWSTESGFNYGVQVTDNLAYGPWSNAVTGVLGTGGEVSVTNNISGSKLFYRSFLDE